jgi:hypothetical protein
VKLTTKQWTSIEKLKTRVNELNVNSYGNEKVLKRILVFCTVMFHFQPFYQECPEGVRIGRFEIFRQLCWRKTMISPRLWGEGDLPLTHPPARDTPEFHNQLDDEQLKDVSLLKNGI